MLAICTHHAAMSARIAYAAATANKECSKSHDPNDLPEKFSLCIKFRPALQHLNTKHQRRCNSCNFV